MEAAEDKWEAAEFGFPVPVSLFDSTPQGLAAQLNRVLDFLQRQPLRPRPRTGKLANPLDRRKAINTAYHKVHEELTALSRLGV